MQLFLNRIFFAVFYITNSIFLQAQVKVSATVSPEIIYGDEYATYRVVIEGAKAIQQISHPAFSNFIVVSGPNEEFWESSLNNQPAKKYYAISYIIQPKTSGKLPVGSVTAKVDGKTYTTSSLQLTVLKNNAPGNKPSQNYPFTHANPNPGHKPPQQEFTDFVLKKGDDVRKKIKDNMHFVLQADKQTCYVGEALVATYNLYTRLKSNTHLVKNPSFNGFSVIDLQQPDDYGFTRKNWQGREYNVYSVRKVQLYPLQPGNFELEAATLDNEVQFLKPEAAANPNTIYNMYNGVGINPDDYILEKVNLTCTPVKIQVKPLPENDKPSDFNGAVGQFEINAAVEKNNIATNEPGKLRIAVSGTGNMQLITAPEIKWPNGVEAYEIKLTDNLNTSTVPVSGTKYFDIPFAITKEGKYSIPAIRYSFFDPVTSSYKTVSTNPVSITVTAAKETKNLFAGSNNVSKENLSPLNRLFKNRPLVITIIAALIIAGLIFWLRKEQKKEEEKEAYNLQQQKEKQLQEEEFQELFFKKAALAQNVLKKTEACLHADNPAEFYVAINKEFKNFLSQKLNLHHEDISSKRIMNAMDNMGVDNSLILQTQNLLQDIDRQVYTPLPSLDGMQETYIRTQQIIQFLNRVNAIQ